MNRREFISVSAALALVPPIPRFDARIRVRRERPKLIQGVWGSVWATANCSYEGSTQPLWLPHAENDRDPSKPTVTWWPSSEFWLADDLESPWLLLRAVHHVGYSDMRACLLHGERESPEGWIEYQPLGFRFKKREKTFQVVDCLKTTPEFSPANHGTGWRVVGRNE